MNCSVENCPKKAKANDRDGMCDMCGKYRDQGYANCSTPECPRPAWSDGLCQVEYQARRTAGTCCSMPDCEREAWSRGLCRRDYGRMHKLGKEVLSEFRVKVAESNAALVFTQREDAGSTSSVSLVRTYGGRGYVYAMMDPRHPENLKLGFTNNLRKRLNAARTWIPFPVYVGTWEFSDTVAAEDHVHRMFAAYHVHGEWYNVTLDQVEDLLGFMTRMAS